MESDWIVIFDEVVRQGVSKADLETEIWGQDGTDHVESEGRAFQAEGMTVQRPKDARSLAHLKSSQKVIYVGA